MHKETLHTSISQLPMSILMFSGSSVLVSNASSAKPVSFLIVRSSSTGKKGRPGGSFISNSVAGIDDRAATLSAAERS